MRMELQCGHEECALKMEGILSVTLEQYKGLEFYVETLYFMVSERMCVSSFETFFADQLGNDCTLGRDEQHGVFGVGLGVLLLQLSLDPRQDVPYMEAILRSGTNPFHFLDQDPYEGMNYAISGFKMLWLNARLPDRWAQLEAESMVAPAAIVWEDGDHPTDSVKFRTIAPKFTPLQSSVSRESQSQIPRWLRCDGVVLDETTTWLAETMPIDKEYRVMLRDAAKPWSPQRHHLWGAGVRRCVYTMLLVWYRWQKERAVPSLPFEVLLHILSFLPRS